MSETTLLELGKNASLLGLLLIVVVLTYKQLIPWLRAYLENQATVLKQIAEIANAIKLQQAQMDGRLSNIEDRLGGIEEENAAIFTKLDMERKPRRHRRMSGEPA